MLFLDLATQMLDNFRLLHGYGQKLSSSSTSLVPMTSVPGGTPFHFCPESRDSDLFQISSAVIDRQPVYIDDVFTVHLEGVFLDSFGPNATLDITENCGSYCDAYNATDPVDRAGETYTDILCHFNYIEQPLGHGRDPRCPPEKGAAMITAQGYAFPMFVWWPAYYNFTFDAKTEDGQRIYCITAEVCMRWEDEEKNQRYNRDGWGNCTWPKGEQLQVHSVLQHFAS